MPEMPVRDKNYDLISVLYHALQGAETLTSYIADAERANDEELRGFLQDTEQRYRAVANQAKKLLAGRLE